MKAWSGSSLCIRRRSKRSKSCAAAWCGEPSCTSCATALVRQCASRSAGGTAKKAKKAETVMSLLTWLTERVSVKKSLGQRGEDAAARYLKRKGYRLLARHLDSPLGELDIIAVDGRTIVFAEVK